MKLIIAGSRDVTDPRTLCIAIRQFGLIPSEVVCGCARGADELGRLWAVARDIPVKLFPADWDTHGKSAGYKRNIQMAEYGDVLLALWDGKSKGTKHMIDIARGKRLKVYIYQPKDDFC